MFHKKMTRNRRAMTRLIEIRRMIIVIPLDLFFLD
jgi:hypothetical protein